MEEKIIISESNNSIIFPNKGINGPVLVIGHQYGMFGVIRNKGLHAMGNVWDNNIQILYSAISSNKKLIFVVPEYVSEYINRLLSFMISSGWFSKRQVEKCVEINSCNTERQMLMKIKEKYSKMKFDYIIQNPPYNRSLHLDFLEKGLDLLTENGKMVIIEPATWLINVRKNGRTKRYDAIKKRIKGHVESVKIENFNKDFGTGLYVPFAITTIDFSKTFDEIEFTCCGEKKVVKSIYDCNLVGEYETIWGILGKCQKFGDMMKNHITNESMGEGVCYSKYDEILPCGIEPAEKNSKLGRSGVYGRDTNYINVLSSEYLYTYIQSVFNRFVPISDTIMKTLKGGSDYKNPKYSGKNADCIYGTRQELENWKHFIFNNKLPLFLNIVLTIDQHNNSKEFLPWLVDKQYADEEINEMLGFTEEEIALIDRTIKKYERNSPWFKRYMCGPDSVSDEEVNNFIKSL